MPGSQLGVVTEKGSNAIVVWSGKKPKTIGALRVGRDCGRLGVRWRSLGFEQGRVGGVGGFRGPNVCVRSLVITIALASFSLAFPQTGVFLLFPGGYVERL